jgi:hypothetical protein
MRREAADACAAEEKGGRMGGKQNHSIGRWHQSLIDGSLIQMGYAGIPDPEMIGGGDARRTPPPKTPQQGRREPGDSRMRRHSQEMWRQRNAVDGRCMAEHLMR